MMTDNEAALELGEVHPGAHTALDYINVHRHKWTEAIFSCAITENRTAQIAASTLGRLINKEPVSDRYLMGLAWFIYNLENGHADSMAGKVPHITVKF